MRFVRVASVAALVALLTWVIGWWAVPLVSFAAGLWWRAEGGRAGSVALGTTVGWGALLLIDTLHPRFGALAAALGGIVHVPGFVLVVVTLAFAALLAWSSATNAAMALAVGSRLWAPGKSLGRQEHPEAGREPRAGN